MKGLAVKSYEQLFSLWENDDGDIISCGGLCALLMKKTLRRGDPK